MLCEFTISVFTGRDSKTILHKSLKMHYIFSMVYYVLMSYRHINYVRKYESCGFCYAYDYTLKGRYVLTWETFPYASCASSLICK